MKVTIFTGNQPRHLNLAEKISKISEKVYLISEVNTVFPNYKNSMNYISKSKRLYFTKVIASEKKFFGNIQFLNNNVNTLPIKSGDLNNLEKYNLKEALNSDFYIVFGASYIKNWLVEFLIENKAINVHIGLSPYYRGAACNFWALYDKKPEYVGATIHLLNKGLDNGDILYHCIPKFLENECSFDFTMRSVLVAHKSLIDQLQNQTIFSIKAKKAIKAKEIRYSKKEQFTDKIVKEFLKQPRYIESKEFNYPSLINPVII